MNDWYKMDAAAAAERLGSDLESGLTAPAAADRLAQHGPNELIEKGIKSPWVILWEQTTEIMVVILIVAAAVSAVLGEWTDAIVIMAIVVINAILGVSQEYRAEQAIAALKKLAVPTVRARRDGKVQEISARDLVPGDIVLVEAGTVVSADGLLVQSINLRVEEAALTGESQPVGKSLDSLSGENVALGDQRNMLFMGTVVTYGRGQMLITATGMQTELGKIADLLQTVEREPTPLQRRLTRLGGALAWAALAIIAVVFVLGIFRSENIYQIWNDQNLSLSQRLLDVIGSEDLKELFLTGIAMAVAAVPEGLAAVVTIALALGSQRMLRRHSLIRKLPAVETLGSVDVICSDKTGTLTENRMTVTVLDVKDRRVTVDTLLEDKMPVLEADYDRNMPRPTLTLSLMLKGMALCNDAVLQQDDDGIWRAVGDPTEGALVVAAAKLGLMKRDLEKRWPRVGEVPFTSARKRMTTVHRVSVDPDDSDVPWRESPFVSFTKGSVDGLLALSSHVWDGSNAIPMDDTMRARVMEANSQKAASGQRVLGVAFKQVGEVPDAATEEAVLESDLTFIGLVGMLDPARPEVKDAVAMARTAGIRPVMITGDHPLTAQHIAEELDIAQPGDAVRTGQELATMSVTDLENIVENVSVYARVSPEHKLNIVTALQEKGHVVAMTGDGVNDAPALKKADIGVAMGITGTDVSKEAADMVLLDDNFATIVAAVEEGRVIYDNIRKFIKYTLSSNTGELWVMLVGPLLGMPLPLVPLQILWINLVTDGLPGLALAVEQAERGTMRRPPFRPDESVFSRGIGRQILWVGVLMGIVSLVPGFFAWREGIREWQTIVFTTLTLSQMGNALAIRSSRDSLFTIGLLSNRFMVLAVGLTFVLQLAVIYVGFLQDIFSTVPLSAGQLAFSLVLSVTVFLAIEVEKIFMRRREE